jgi:hypothetical protein
MTARAQRSVKDEQKARKKDMLTQQRLAVRRPSNPPLNLRPARAGTPAPRTHALTNAHLPTRNR